MTLFAGTAVSLILVADGLAQAPAPAPAPATPAPAVPTTVATINSLMNEAEAAFEAKDYVTAAPKLEALIKALGPNSSTTPEVMEMLHFNVGLAYRLGEKPAEAEAAFAACVAKFPKGEYATRCHLGVGLACIAQGTPGEKRAGDQVPQARHGRPQISLRSRALARPSVQ